MRAAARNLEFERAAVLRDEIQQIRLRVLEEDASADVARAAERAGRASGESTARGAAGSRATSTRRPGQRAAPVAAPTLEVTTVTVLPATAEEPDDALAEPTAATASDWLPGIRDEHDDDGGWQARWLDRPTWDRTVTPNVDQANGKQAPSAPTLVSADPGSPAVPRRPAAAVPCPTWLRNRSMPDPGSATVPCPTLALIQQQPPIQRSLPFSNGDATPTPRRRIHSHLAIPVVRDGARPP